jgi:hypothetical protein
MMRIVALGYVAMSSATAGETTKILKIKVTKHLATARVAVGDPTLKNDKAIMVFPRR